MGLEDLRKKFHGEARKTSPKFWNPKVGDSLVGKLYGTRQIGDEEEERLVFYNYPSEEYFILPNHGHLKKQISMADVGKFFYIELASESLLKKGKGVGKMGKIYFVHELDPDERQQVEASEGTEDKIGGEDVAVDDEDVGETTEDDSVPF